MTKVVAFAIAMYGAYCLVKREVILYMTLQSTFVFFDFGEPRICFFIDYLSIMGLFVFMGHYTLKIAKSITKKRVVLNNEN